MISNDPKELAELVAAIYEQRKDQVSISPSWLAGEALHMLDPQSLAPPLITLAADLQLRQIARQFCARREKEDDDLDPEQQTLFRGLQRRYPVRHVPGEEPQYVLRDHLSGADVAFNVARLRLEGQAKLAHADALEAWGQQHAG